MKRISLLLVASCAFLNLVSQNTPAGSPSDTMLIAFNSEKIIEKAGFDNLMKLMQESKPLRKLDMTAQAQIRKALAALYGAGIDFSRKAVFTMLSPSSYPKDILSLEKIEMPRMSFVVPVADPVLFEKNILILLNTDKEDKKEDKKEEYRFTKEGNLSYLILSDNTLLILSDKALMVTAISRTFNFNLSEPEGRIVKQDTIIESLSDRPEWLTGVTEVKKWKDAKIVDRFQNGKIIRVYQPQKTNIKTDKARPGNKKIEKLKVDDVTTSEVDFGPPPPPLEDSTTITFTPPAIMDDEVLDTADFPKTAIEPENITDTLTTTKRLNDSTRILIYYIPYSIEEAKEIAAKKEQLKKEEREKKIKGLLSGFATELPYASTHPDIIQTLEAKNDITMYGNRVLPTKAPPFGNMFSNFVIGGMRRSSILPNAEKSTFITHINFENGALTAHMQTGCCGAYNEWVGKLYQPVTDFWPRELNGPKSPMAGARMNLNLKELLSYMFGFIPEKEKEEIKANGIEPEKLAEIFTGEMAVVALPAESQNKKRTPSLLMALKLKDPAKAVALMNKLAGQDLKMVSNYRFDTQAEYLLFCSKDEYFTTPQKPGVAPMFTVGNKGEIWIDIKEMIRQTTRPSKINDKETQNMIQFLGRMSFVNNSTEDGRFASDMRIEMGDKNKNALTSLMDLIRRMQEKSSKK